MLDIQGDKTLGDMGFKHKFM